MEELSFAADPSIDLTPSEGASPLFLASIHKKAFALCFHGMAAAESVAATAVLTS